MSTTNGSTARTGHGGKVLVGDYDGSDPAGDTYLVARCTSWSINPTSTEAAWADSDSAGYTNRRSGRRDCTGSIGGKLDMTYPQYKNFLFRTDSTNPEDDDMVTLVLYEDGNETTPTTYWYFPRVLLSNFQMSLDMDTREPVDWSCDFGADGRFYMPGDSTIPSITYADHDDLGTPSVNANG